MLWWQCRSTKSLTNLRPFNYLCSWFLIEPCLCSKLQANFDPMCWNLQFPICTCPLQYISWDVFPWVFSSRRKILQCFFCHAGQGRRPPAPPHEEECFRRREWRGSLHGGAQWENTRTEDTTFWFVSFGEGFGVKPYTAPHWYANGCLFVSETLVSLLYWS